MMLALLVLAAAPQTGVVVVQMSTCCCAEAWPEAEGAQRDELRAAGLAVELVIGTATGERERRIELGVLAEEKNAACAVRISRPSGASSIEMRVSDRVTGKVLFREILLGSPGGAGASAQLSVGAHWEHFEHLPLSLDATLSVFGGGAKSEGLRSTFETVHVRLVAGCKPWAGRVRPSLMALAGVSVPFAALPGGEEARTPQAARAAACGGRRRFHAIHSTHKTAEQRLLQLGHQLPSRIILPPTTAQPSLPLAG